MTRVRMSPISKARINVHFFKNSPALFYQRYCMEVLAGSCVTQKQMINNYYSGKIHSADNPLSAVSCGLRVNIDRQGNSVFRAQYPFQPVIWETFLPKKLRLMNSLDKLHSRQGLAVNRLVIISNANIGLDIGTFISQL